MALARDSVKLRASKQVVRAWRKAVGPAGRAAFTGPGQVDPTRCAVYGDSEVFIDAYSYAQGLQVYSGAGVGLTIGRFCSIADRVAVLVGGRHDLTAVTTSPWLQRLVGPGPDASAGDVVVEHDVWIGHGATITSGVTVSTGSVVLAHAVVTKDVAPYEIVGGVPARHVGWRFDEDTRATLLASRWWEGTEEELRAAAPYAADPAAFLRVLAEQRGPGPAAQDDGARMGR